MDIIMKKSFLLDSISDIDKGFVGYMEVPPIRDINVVPYAHQ